MYKCLGMRVRWECSRTSRSLLMSGEDGEQGGRSQA